MSDLKNVVDGLTKLYHFTESGTLATLGPDVVEKNLAKALTGLTVYTGMRNERQRMSVTLWSPSAAGVDESIEVVRIGVLFLISTVSAHVKENLGATPKTVEYFNKSAELILDLLNQFHSVNERTYESAYEAHIKLRALRACGVIPPGHREAIFSERFGPKTVDAEALKYVADNAVEFVKFAFHLGERHHFIPDPLEDRARSEAFNLFLRVRGVALPAGMPLPNR